MEFSPSKLKMAALVAVNMAATVLALNYGVHVGSAYAYSKFCIPQDVWDVARSFVTTASPVCSFLLNTMQVTQNNFAIVITTTVTTLAATALKA
jgi:hypothetical protein